MKFEEPFRHWILDDWINETLAIEYIQNDEWVYYSNDMERKRTSSAPPSKVLSKLTDPAAITQLETITGIDGLKPDLYGGGLHVYSFAGFLAPHIDYSIHPKSGMERRLNAILFLNRRWVEPLGGALQFYDDMGEKVLKSIYPRYGRLVLWEPTDTSFHGCGAVYGPYERVTVAVNYVCEPRPTATNRKRALFVPNRSKS